VDLTTGKIYVADGTGGHSVKVANLDGSGDVTTLFDPGVNVSGLALVPESQAWPWLSSAALILVVTIRKLGLIRF